MNLTLRVHVTTITNTFRALGVPVPKPVAAAFDSFANVRERASAYEPRQGELEAAVFAAMADDRDPTTDADVTRLVVGAAVSNPYLTAALSNLAESALRNDMAGRVDVVLDAWRPAFDRAAADIQAAWDDLEGIDLSDTNTIVQRGPEAAAAWAQAQKAATVLTATRDGVNALAELASYSPQEFSLLRIATVTLSAWQNHNLGRRKAPAPWELVGIEGVALNLADTETVSIRVEELRRAQAEAARRAEKAMDQARKLALRG